QAGDDAEPEHGTQDAQHVDEGAAGKDYPGTARSIAARNREGPAVERRVSMADVARLAGVSSQTVSRVSNGHPGVIGSTREQVLAAMQKLGYRPNSAARALRYGRFNTIGVILFGLSSTGNSRTVEAIATQAAAQGYAITLIPVGMPTQA